MSQCSYCPAPVYWVMTERRKRMPLCATQRTGDGGRTITEPTEFEDGNVAPTGRTAFGSHGEQVPVVAVRRAGSGRWKAHWVDCPNPPQRKGRS